jgi:hypothetical protein
MCSRIRGQRLPFAKLNPRQEIGQITAKGIPKETVGRSTADSRWR